MYIYIISYIYIYICKVNFINFIEISQNISSSIPFYYINYLKYVISIFKYYYNIGLFLQNVPISVYTTIILMIPPIRICNIIYRFL